MNYIKTKEATDFPEKKSLGEKILRTLLFFIPKANPGYEGKYHLINEWLIEFDDNNDPIREIALNENNEVLFTGPSKQDYGFWLDSNMKFDNFKDVVKISSNEFEIFWDNE